MKYKTFIVIILIMFLVITNRCKNVENKQDVEGYQEAKWGMTRKEIKDLIKLPLTNEVNNILMYNDVIEGDNVTRMYIFNNEDKLFGVMIFFVLPYEIEEYFRNKFIEIYNRVAFKYGDADTYIDEDLAKKGLFASWKFKKSEILLQLTFKKPFNKLALGLLYLDKLFAKEYYKSYSLDKF